ANLPTFPILLSHCLQVFDQFQSFIALEDHLFISNMKNSYRAFHSSGVRSILFCPLNSDSSSDEEAMNNVNMVVDSLFSVCATLGKVPIIRCAKSGHTRHLFLASIRLRSTPALPPPLPFFFISSLTTQATLPV